MKTTIVALVAAAAVAVGVAHIVVPIVAVGAASSTLAADAAALLLVHDVDMVCKSPLRDQSDPKMTRRMALVVADRAFSAYVDATVPVAVQESAASTMMQSRVPADALQVRHLVVAVNGTKQIRFQRGI